VSPPGMKWFRRETRNKGCLCPAFFFRHHADDEKEFGANPVIAPVPPTTPGPTPKCVGYTVLIV